MLPEISRSMLKNSLVLALFAAVTVAVVAITQQSTESRIIEAERAAQIRTLGEILPAHSYDNALLDNVISLNEPLLGHRTETPAYLATLAGQPAAVILQANAPDGYSGTISLLIGIMADGTLSGVRVIHHKETPGLGDRIELAKSPWINSFDGKSLSNPAQRGWAVKKIRAILTSLQVRPLPHEQWSPLYIKLYSTLISTTPNSLHNSIQRR